MWNTKKNKVQKTFNAERVLMAAKTPIEEVFAYFQTTSLGLVDEEVEKRQSLYGKNEIEHEKKKRPLVMLAKAFITIPLWVCSPCWWLSRLSWMCGWLIRPTRIGLQSSSFRP